MQQPEWKGSQPQRFHGGRIHLRPEDQLNNKLSPQYSTICTAGIKTFSHGPTKEMVHKPSLKIYNQSYSKSTKQIDLKGKLFIPIPEPKERIRPQRCHLPGGFETIDEVNLKGLKTYDSANQTRNLQYQVQTSMQKKIRLNGLQPLRNHLPVTSLGDKSYKYPQYSSNFYHEGGLIPGATQKPRVNKAGSETKIFQILTKPNWDVKMKMQEKEEQKRVVDSVDEWEQTVLKEANPNWNDPETFFEREEGKKKDPKKGGKK